jgi:hypothetical protein
MIKDKDSLKMANQSITVVSNYLALHYVHKQGQILDLTGLNNYKYITKTLFTIIKHVFVRNKGYFIRTDN